MIKEITDSNIQDLLAEGKPVVVDFGLHGVVHVK